MLISPLTTRKRVYPLSGKATWTRPKGREHIRFVCAVAHGSAKKKSRGKITLKWLGYGLEVSHERVSIGEFFEFPAIKSGNAALSSGAEGF